MEKLWQSFQSLVTVTTALIISQFLEYADRAYDRQNRLLATFRQWRDLKPKPLRTLTAWDNEASMQIYMMADAHRSNAKVSRVVGWSLVCALESRQFGIASWDIAEQWMAEQENYRWNIPQRRIFGINLVFKNGRERAERIGVQEDGQSTTPFWKLCPWLCNDAAHKNLTSTIRIWKKSSIGTQ